MLTRDADYFLKLQTETGWGRTLYGFAAWCSPKAGWCTLDVGCGPGLLPAIFAKFGCNAFGIDLDAAMFQPSPLYPEVAVADVADLPFSSHVFDLITVSNLLFMVSEPIQVLKDIKRCLGRDGRLAMLNPSESLTEQAAVHFADETGMHGIGRDTLLNWSRRSAENCHWTEAETYELYQKADMQCMGTALKVGPGFGRFSWGMAKSVE